MSLSVIILAAGLGKRMRSHLPKVLQPIAGTPMLQRVIIAATKLNPCQVIIIYGHKGPEIQEKISSAVPKIELTWVMQAEQLGTGHAVQLAMPHLHTKTKQILVLCGDVPLITDNTLKHLVAATKDLGIITNKLSNPSGFGRIIRDNNNNISAIIEEKDANIAQKKIGEINTGIILLSKSFLINNIAGLNANNKSKELYLTDLIAIAAKQNLNIASIAPCHAWETIGVNNKVELAKLERIWQQHIATQLMLQHGVSLLDSERFDLRGEIQVGHDVTIDLNNLFEGTITLGNNVTIGPNCYLKNVTLGDNVTIKANSVLEDTIVAKNSIIGPFARLRPGTRLSAGVKVGNFVEIKKSAVGENSKINHLSYIGDTVIGTNVNIGAGSITCNYDGANKHQTIIEDDVFIGSNSIFIAPVTVEQNATVAAGTIVTKTALANKLTIGRAQQKTISSWQRPTKKTQEQE